MTWNKLKLGDLLEVQNGYAFHSKKFNTLDGMPLIRIRDLKNGVSTKTYYTGKYEKKYIVHSGDFLIGMDGEFRCYQWKGKDALLNQRVCRLQNFTEQLNPKFLHYIINKELKLIEDKTGFITVKHLSSNTIKEIKISMPSLQEQQHIVAKLDVVFAEMDKTINVAKHKKEEVDILRQDILVKELKIDGDVKKLSDVCQINNGGTPDSKNKLYWGDNNHWLTPKDMGKLSSHHVDASERQITDEGLDNSSAKLVPKNSVILSCRAPIGYLAINSVPMSFNQGCKGLVPKPNLLAKYLYYFLLSSKQLLNDLGSGTTFKEISSKTLSNVIINIPSLIEQKRIVAKLDLTFAEVKKIKSYTEKQIVNYQTLKSAILTKELQKEAA